MTNKLRAIVLMLAASFCVTSIDGRGQRPAPSPSRYAYVLKFDVKALPKGVTIREVTDKLGTRHFITNTSDVPLIINERFQGNRIVSGVKLVSGKVCHYCPDGVPMAGKRHLKGWQAPFGDIKQTLITLPRPPARIYQGRKPGLSKEIPKPESFSIKAKFNGKSYEIKGMIHYKLNPAYDKQVD
ncbi:MAG: hypothetical protein QGF00_31375 [Planctomycetota bacterium]|nr:hypothetical protein [Planctomycetota bacterium]MDP7254144.1 hypothetical protein [Planctomycetota bacterium]